MLVVPAVHTNNQSQNWHLINTIDLITRGAASSHESGGQAPLFFSLFLFFFSLHVLIIQLAIIIIIIITLSFNFDVMCAAAKTLPNGTTKGSKRA
jgi:hypothetical protein